MSVALQVRPRSRSGDGARIEATARRCLSNVAGTWHVMLSPSDALAHWWVVELLRGEDGFRRQFFVNGMRDLEAEVCGRITSVVRGAERAGHGWATTLPCGAPHGRDAGEGEGGIEIDVTPSVPRELRERFENAVRHVFEGRSGSYRVRMDMGRTDGEVVLLVSSARRSVPLPLFFPNAPTLGPEEVARIVANVLEGMGPAFR